MSAIELLESLNALDEHEHIEAKRGSDTGRSLLETVCAFSNEPGLGGGSILLGVERDDLSLFPSYSAVGVAQPDKVSAEIATQCRDMFNVPVRVDVSTEQVDGKPVIVVTVPEAPPHDKPIFFKNTGLPKGAFRRVGSTDQRCTDDDVALLYQGREQQSYDSGIVADASLEDISSEAIAEYRRSQSEFNVDAEALRWTDLELLQALGAVRRHAKGEDWKPTVAGLIVFGTRQALRRCFPMTRVDYIRVPGKEWVPDPEKRFDTVELRDPLFKLIRRAQAAVLDDLPQSFGLEEGQLQRTDTPIIPQRVIREALVNAVMHRSYRNHGPVQIIRYANRLEIRNPGFSLKSPEHLGEPGSQPRNPKIAAILHETRFAETKGSGIRVMREMMSEAGLTPPVFESDRGRDEFVARYLFHHFLGADDIAWLANFRDLHLTDEDAKALIVVREAGAIDNASYRQLNRVDTLAASQALRRLRDAAVLEQKGRGSATFYVPGLRLKGMAGNATAASSFDQGTSASSKSGASVASLSVESLPLSVELSALSGEFPSLSGDLPPLSGESRSLANRPDLEQLAAKERRSTLLAPVPGDVAALVGGLGERSRPQQVKTVIKELLTLRAWQIDELSTVLRRNPAYIREQYLQPMVQDGVIQMTHPNEPNHPAQAYRVRSE
ncbi:MAG TPA: transcriptional regulator [Gemmatimonas aurantiaca]|uniref:Transcriptional regulator n=2 Tax=Gemmatimonas aurantiaca TaxID=173480 RepID=C1A4R1_GEMAT|nr:ATP-binding protein [Gemmatimonas aurantiaca]BAH37221.1 hypothetical protein GAU_0179 [Gemmatimonas aurantiaca T-27]HCT55637.1 transcriptional regulator [Gemmatimonas aurantiaca]